MTVHAILPKPVAAGVTDTRVPLGFLHDLATATSPEAVSDSYIEWGFDIMGATRCTIGLQVTNDTMTLRQAARRQQNAKPRVYPIAGSLIGRVLMDRESCLVTKLHQQSYAGCRTLAATGTQTLALAPMIAGERCFGVISAGFPTGAKVDQDTLAALEVIAHCLAARILAIAQMSELRTLSQTDPLTGAYNRNFFQSRAAKHWTDWKTIGRPFCIATVDLDHFKLVNDTMGHAIGDLALCETVKRLKSHLRSGDTIVRLGGEEFCVLLGGVSQDIAAPLVTRMHKVIDAEPMKTDAGLLAVTASIGVASVDYEDENFEETLARSDAALYAAKRNGRNRVELHCRASD